MEILRISILTETTHMKLIQNAVVAACALTAMQTNAQSPPATSGSNSSPSAIVQPDNPVSGFKRRNKDVKSVSWQDGQVIIITKKDGAVEKYDLNNKDEVAKAESQYGKLPATPPPPPPVVGPPPPPPPAPPKVEKFRPVKTTLNKARVLDQGS
jgi:hypothetical protein